MGPLRVNSGGRSPRKPCQVYPKCRHVDRQRKLRLGAMSDHSSPTKRYKGLRPLGGARLNLFELNICNLRTDFP